MANKEDIIEAIRSRLLEEHEKYAHQDEMDWARIAAHKIYSTHFSDIRITKQIVEKALGYEIDEFECDPVFDKETIIGYSIRIKPKTDLVFMENKVIIGKNGDILFNE